MWASPTILWEINGLTTGGQYPCDICGDSGHTENRTDLTPNHAFQVAYSEHSLPSIRVTSTVAEISLAAGPRLMHLTEYNFCILSARIRNQKKKMISVKTDIGNSIDRTHYALVPSHEFSFSPALREFSDLLRRDWEHLEPDPHMADGGGYRLRRYGLYQLFPTTGQLEFIPDASFYQSIKINPLNGGQARGIQNCDSPTAMPPIAVAVRRKRPPACGLRPA